jgi:hypothetical protein
MIYRRELLDAGSVSDILKSKTLFEALAEFHWEYYSDLAFQRNRIREQLLDSLRERAAPFQFPRWQRAVKYKYSLTPLSTKGSLVDPGGRFNIGAIDATRFPLFPALYLASEKSTALAELLGREETINSFTPEELALTKPDSITIVSVSGKLESALDIRQRHNLEGFVKLVRGFKLRRSLRIKARRLRFPVDLIGTVTELAAALQQQNWREWPMVFDVPTTAQIFGGLVLDARIDAIVYASVLTQEPCVAIFPQNFLNSSSYVELDDPAPEEVRRRIDANTFQKFI